MRYLAGPRVPVYLLPAERGKERCSFWGVRNLQASRARAIPWNILRQHPAGDSILLAGHQEMGFQ